MTEHRCDVLVIGAGAAGLRAAIAAHEAAPNLDVLVITKGEAGRSGATAWACSDRMAFHATLPYTAPGGPDNWRRHAEDIYRIGGYVSDGDLAGILARESAQAFEYLDRLGVPWVKREGRAEQFVTDGSEFARACYTGPYTARDIEQALLARVRQTPVRALENQQAVDLLVGRDGCAGAVGLDQRTGEPWRIPARAVVLATGGAGEAYAVHVYPAGMTGDGYAMAYRAGAELVNMEFIQIGLSSVATQLACSGSVMRAVPRFSDGRGHEFLARRLDMSPAEVHNLVFAKGSKWPASVEEQTTRLDIAVARELGARERVFLDFSRDPEGFDLACLEEKHRERFEAEAGPRRDPAQDSTPLGRLRQINPQVVEWLKERGVDLERGHGIEIAPAVQHFQGGVKIGEWGETAVPGLYACGECAGGQHGANRPGGNALLDTQVFGRRAGEAAARHAVETPAAGAVQRTDTLPAFEAGGAASSEARTRLRLGMSGHAAVIRTPEGLSDLLALIADIHARGIAVDRRGPSHAFETRELLDVAEMVVRAAAMRTESRGPHLYFTDPAGDPAPRDDANWRKYLVITRREGEMRLEARTPQPLPT